MLDLSLTTSVYFPAFVGFFVSVIVKPGPTVPSSFGVAAPAGSATTAAMASSTTTSLLMVLPRPRWPQSLAVVVSPGSRDLPRRALVSRERRRPVRGGRLRRSLQPDGRPRTQRHRPGRT